MNDDWLKRLHHNGHAELIERIKAQYRYKQNRREVAPLVSLLNRQEIIMLRRLDRRYRDLAKKIAEEFERTGRDGAIQAITLSDQQLEELILTTNTETAGIAGNWQAVRLQNQKGQKSEKNIHEVIETNLEAFLLAGALNSVSSILQTDREAAATIIARGVEEGLGEREISRSLQSAFAGRLGKIRASKIARTEIGISGSRGQNEGAKEEGAEQKLWVAIDDDRTRGHHIDINLRRVKINEFFTPLGENMSHPHDTQHGATPRNFINCRCLVLYD